MSEEVSNSRTRKDAARQAFRGRDKAAEGATVHHKGAPQAGASNRLDPVTGKRAKPSPTKGRKADTPERNPFDRTPEALERIAALEKSKEVKVETVGD